MINEKISIIIPVYNVESYVERCLDSILKQKYQHFEVICVDDGSTDASGALCDAYQKKDSRIRVFHTENRGVSNARNYALSLMEGAWFCFIDPDDWITPEYLSKLYSLAKQNDCEIAACHMRKAYEYCDEYDSCEEQVVMFDSSKACVHNFICNEHSMQGMCTNKLYLSAKFKEYRFDTTLKVNEDCLYTYEVMSNCNKACMTTLPLYYWFIRSDSACHKKNRALDFSPSNVFVLLHDKTLEDHNDAVTKTLQMNYINSVVKVLLFAKYKSSNMEVKDAKKRCKEWRKNVWSMLDFKSKMKYLYAIYSFRL